MNARNKIIYDTTRPALGLGGGGGGDDVDNLLRAINSMYSLCLHRVYIYTHNIYILYVCMVAVEMPNGDGI